jgi:hypothetical protein
MAHLTLTGVSDDGKRLLLVSDKGVEFTLDITPSLRGALNGETSRIGQLEIPMESALRPRDIQARIRAGETPEAVAEAAHTTVDKIMTYAGPVLAEREHVADRAQRSSVRRVPGESTGGARTLGDAVSAHLRSTNVDPTTVVWDAWRREDGRWSLVARFETPERRGTAGFTYDAPGNYVVLDDDDARWLVGEVVAGAAPPPTPARNDLEQARQRRLSAVPESELPLGEDAIELVTQDGSASLEADSPVEAFLDESPASDDPELREEAAEAAALDDEDAGDEAEPPTRRQVTKKRGRASVPSWDEIMFGGGDQ